MAAGLTIDGHDRFNCQQLADFIGTEQSTTSGGINPVLVSRGL